VVLAGVACVLRLPGWRASNPGVAHMVKGALVFCARSVARHHDLMG